MSSSSFQGSNESNEQIIDIQNISKDAVKPIKRIFINYLNSYTGKEIVKAILSLNRPTETVETDPNTLTYQIFGTIQKTDLPNSLDTDQIQIIDSNDPNYMEKVLTADLIVYDINYDLRQVLEAQKVLQELEKLPEDSQNYEFLLISTIMTWAKTKPNPDDDDPTLTEVNYRKRRPHHCYTQHQFLERELINAQVRHRSFLRTCVLCPGVVYGGEQDIFHYLYKMAYCNKTEVQIFKPGSNTIPVIYLNDFVNIVCNFVKKFPKRKSRYILAVQPESVDYFTIAQLAARYVSGDDVRVKVSPRIDMFLIDRCLMTPRVANYCNLNLKMTSTYLAEYPFMISGDLETFGEKLAIEYRQSRDLMPIKIIISGPPCSGKSTLARSLADYYGVHLVNVEEVLIDAGKKLNHKIKAAESYLEYVKLIETEEIVENKTDEDPLKNEENEVKIPEPTLPSPITEDYLEGVRTKIFEWNEKLTELTEYLTQLGDDETPNFEYVKRYLLEFLQSKCCAENQGYILDGFPFVYAQSKELFDDDQEENPEADGPFIKAKLKPELVIILNADDQLLCNRAMVLPEDKAIKTRNTEEKMLSRLLTYRTNNEEDQSVLNYFLDRDIIPLEINLTNANGREEILDKVKRQIGPPRVYPLTKTELNDIDRIERVKREKEQEFNRQIRLKHEEEEKDRQEQRLETWMTKFLQLKQQEQEMLEVQSLPLRHYLMKFVLPTLTNGLIEVVKQEPDDPIDFLAEFLFKSNPTGRMLDPGYSDEAKHLLLTKQFDITATDDDEEEVREGGICWEDQMEAAVKDNDCSSV